jgi:hypothetical protein
MCRISQGQLQVSFDWGMQNLISKSTYQYYAKKQET